MKLLNAITDDTAGFIFISSILQYFVGKKHFDKITFDIKNHKDGFTVAYHLCFTSIFENQKRYLKIATEECHILLNGNCDIYKVQGIPAFKPQDYTINEFKTKVWLDTINKCKIL